MKVADSMRLMERFLERQSHAAPRWQDHYLNVPIDSYTHPDLTSLQLDASTWPSRLRLTLKSIWKMGPSRLQSPVDEPDLSTTDRSGFF